MMRSMVKTMKEKYLDGPMDRPSSFIAINKDEVTGRLRHIPAEKLPEEVGPIRAKEEIKVRIEMLSAAWD